MNRGGRDREEDTPAAGSRSRGAAVPAHRRGSRGACARLEVNWKCFWSAAEGSGWVPLRPLALPADREVST
jgi:hypothetical protein